MIYLVHDNNEINEINLIYYNKPPEGIEYYKAIEEEGLPPEKEGHYRKLIYTKSSDTVSAEYTPIPPTGEEKLREELEKTKLEFSMALVEMTELITSGM